MINYIIKLMTNITMLDINEIANNIINTYHYNKKVTYNFNDISFTNILKTLNLILNSTHHGTFSIINNGIILQTKKNFKMERSFVA